MRGQRWLELSSGGPPHRGVGAQPCGWGQALHRSSCLLGWQPEQHRRHQKLHAVGIPLEKRKVMQIFQDSMYVLILQGQLASRIDHTGNLDPAVFAVVEREIRDDVVNLVKALWRCGNLWRSRLGLW